MSEREWKPGEVAWFKTSRTQGLAFRCGVPKNLGWELVIDAGTTKQWSSDESMRAVGATFRPLAVIDPEDSEAVDRLTFLYHENRSSLTATVKRSDDMAAALREFADPKPPKPAEPTGLGAVVESRGAKYVRVGLSLKRPWQRASDSNHLAWDEIDDPEVLNDGVTP